MAALKKRLAPIAALLLLLLTLTGCSLPFGPAAAAKKAGGAFITAATAGDRAKVESMLAPGHTVDVDQFIGQFQGMTIPEAFDVFKAGPNQSGVEYLVLINAYDRTGRPYANTLAMRRESGVWVVLKAGPGFAY